MEKIDFIHKFKNNKEIAIIFIVILLITNAILFLYLMLPETEKGNLVLQNIPIEAFKVGTNLPDYGLENGPKQPQGAYVASKSGQKYYPLNCSGAAKLTEENRVWFNSKEEAEAAGYAMAKSCY